MAHDYRQQHHRNRPPRYRAEDRDERNREDWRPGENRDPYAAGGERRYMADRSGRSPGQAFQGERNYPVSGYPEEFGSRSEGRRDERRSRGYGELTDSYGRLRWEDEPPEAEYFGAGSHYGGGFGTAPGSRVSASGSWGAEGYGRMGAWSESEDWAPETSGDYQSYGRAPYGAQSGYGRSYGDTEPNRQSFRGRGPKGYVRTDDRIREMVCERLTDDPWIDASEVDVDVTQGVVKLTGAAPNRSTKYAIEDLVERCSGVKDVDNQLRVKATSLSSGAEAGVASSAESASAAGRATRKR